MNQRIKLEEIKYHELATFFFRFFGSSFVLQEFRTVIIVSWMTNISDFQPFSIFTRQINTSFAKNKRIEMI